MYTEEMIQIRRHLHRHPELSFEEEETAGYICRFLDDLDVAHKRVATSVIAYIDTGVPGRHKAFRGDMDALPVAEQSDTSYCSANAGIMHACGHDAHTAILLMLVKRITDDPGAYSGRFTFIFQHGEEQPPGGAGLLIEEGVLEGVQEIYGLHCDPTVQVGKVASKVGPLMSSVDRIRIEVKGVGGHGAMPHLCIDPIVVAANIINALQTVVSRRTDPLDSALVTIGQIHGGNSFNVITDVVTMEGTVRTLSKTTRKMVEELCRDLCTGIASANGASADVYWTKGYPVLNNSQSGIDRLTGVIEAMEGISYETMADPRLLAEDFASYLEVVPGAFFFLGTRGNDATAHPLHSPYFDIDERALAIGLKILLALAKQ